LAFPRKTTPFAEPGLSGIAHVKKVCRGMGELGRPAAQVKTAVQAVGPLVSDVREYLRRRALDGLTR
jgi:hypothetical protein